MMESIKGNLPSTHPIHNYKGGSDLPSPENTEMEEDDVVDYLLHCDASNNMLTIKHDLPVYASCSNEESFSSRISTTSQLAHGLNANATRTAVTITPSLALDGESAEKHNAQFSHVFKTHNACNTLGQQTPNSAVPGYDNSVSHSCKCSKTTDKKHKRSASDGSITINWKFNNEFNGPLLSNSVCANGIKPQGTKEMPIPSGATNKIRQNKDSDTTFNLSGNKIPSGTKKRKLVRSLSNKWESPPCDNKCNLSDHTPPPPPPSVKKLLRKFEIASNPFAYDSSSEENSNTGNEDNQSFKESSSKISKLFKCLAEGSPDSEEFKSERILKLSYSEPTNYNHNFKPSLDRTKSEPSSLNGGTIDEHVPPKVVNLLKMQFETSSPKLKRTSSFAKNDDTHGHKQENLQRNPSSPKEKLGKLLIQKGKDRRVAPSECNERLDKECTKNDTLKEARCTSSQKQEKEIERDPGTPSVKHLAKRFEEVVSAKSKKTLRRSVNFPQTYIGENESSVKTAVPEMPTLKVPDSKIRESENKMKTLVDSLSCQSGIPYPDLNLKNVYERSEDSEYVTFKRIVQVIDIPLYECSKKTMSHEETLNLSQEEHSNLSSSSFCKIRETIVEDQVDRELENVTQMNNIPKDFKKTVTFREKRNSECSASPKLETKENLHEMIEKKLTENSNIETGNEREKENYGTPITNKPLKAAEVPNKSLLGEIERTKGNTTLNKDAKEEKLQSKVNMVQSYERLFQNIDHTTEEKVQSVHRSNFTEDHRELDVTLLIEKFKSCKRGYLNSSSYQSDEEWASPPKRNKEYTPIKSPGNLSPSCDDHLSSLDTCNGKLQLNRKNSDVALLIDKFTNLNKRKTSSGSSQSSRGETEDFSPEQTQCTSTPMAKGKNFQGKVRYLYSDELRFFDEDEDDTQPFVRSQSLRLHRTQSMYVGESFKRSQSLRQKKTNSESKDSSQSECRELNKSSFSSAKTPTHSSKTPTHSSKVSNKPFRYLYPEELEYFNKNFNNIYPVKEIHSPNMSNSKKFGSDMKSDGDTSLGNSESESDCCILRECVSESSFHENQYFEQFISISGFIHCLDKTEDQANIENDCLNLSIMDSEMSDEMIKVPVKKVDLLEINSDLEENLTDQDLSFKTVCLDSFDTNESLQESGKQEYNHELSKDRLTMSNCSETYFDCFTEAISSRASSIEHTSPIISGEETVQQNGSLSNSVSKGVSSLFKNTLNSQSAHTFNVTYILHRDSDVKAEDSAMNSPFPNKKSITTDQSGESMKRLEGHEFANHDADIWDTISPNFISNSRRDEVDQPACTGHEQTEMYFDSKDVNFENGLSSSQKKYLSQGRRQSDVTHLIKKFNKLTSKRHSMSLDASSDEWSSLHDYSKDIHDDSSGNSKSYKFMESYHDARGVERRDSNVASVIEKFRNLEKGKFSSSNSRPKEKEDYFQNSIAYSTKNNFPSKLKSGNENCPKVYTKVNKERTEFLSDNLEIPDNLRAERRDSDVALLIQKFSQLNIRRHSSYSSQSSSMESLEMSPENSDNIAPTRKVKNASGMFNCPRGCRELYPNESKYFLNDVAYTYTMPCINECTFILQRESESISLREHKPKESTFSNNLILPEWVPSLNETPNGNTRGNKIYLSPSNILSPASKLLANTSDISNVDSKFEKLYHRDHDSMNDDTSFHDSFYIMEHVNGNRKSP